MWQEFFFTSSPRLFSLLFRPKVYWLSCCTFSSSVILLTRSFTRSSMGALASLLDWVAFCLQPLLRPGNHLKGGN